MALLKINFDDVPDTTPPIPSGIYTCEVVSCSDPEPSKSGGTKIVVVLKITDEGEHTNRKLWDHLSTTLETRIKNLFMACGAPFGAEGGDTTDLIGQALQVKVVSETYTDDAGVVKESSKIGGYIFEATDD